MRPLFRSGARPFRGRVLARPGARVVFGTALAIQLVLLGAGSAWAQTSSTPAQGPGTPAAPPVPVDVTGATEIDYDGATEEYTFRGARVVVTRGEQRLVAPVIFYRASTRRAELPERGTVSTPTEELTADHIVAELGARHLLAEGQAAGRFLDQGVWASMTADRVEVWDQADRRDVVADGHVVAVRGDQELRGDHVTYDRGAQHATVDGDAVVTRGGDRLQADQVVADLGTRDAVATGHVTLDRTAEAMHGTADRATYTGGTDTTVLVGHAMLTRNRDVVTADTITVSMAQHHATADGQSTVVAYPQGSDQGASP